MFWGLTPRCLRRIAGPMRWSAVLMLALALRLVSWSRVTSDDPSVGYLDGDSLYHAFRAEQIAGDFPHVPWTDPLLGDGGIEVPWPPLFDVIIAGAALVAYGAPTSVEVARVAAWTPVLIGVATVPLVGLLGGLVAGPELALGAALLFALSVPHAFYSVLGRSDQHVLELLLTVAILTSFVAALGARTARKRGVMVGLLGAMIALSFWNWLGSALNLLFLSAFVAVWHVFTPRESSRGAMPPPAALAAACLVGAVVLAGTLTLFGPEGALWKVSVLGATGLHVLLIAWTGLAASGLCLARRLRPHASASGRAVEVAVVSVAPLVAVAAVPGAIDGISHGLIALLSANRWYASISEFKPLLFGGYEPPVRELANAFLWYGLGPVLAVAGGAALRDRWRRAPSTRMETLLLATWGACSFLLAVARYRFALYAAPALAIWSWLGIRYVLEHRLQGLSQGRFGAAFVTAVVMATAAGPVVGFVRNHAFEPQRLGPGPLLTWLRERPDPTGAPTVYAQWDHGHHVRVLARRPAVANPFGLEGGADGFEESQRVFRSSVEQEVEQVLGVRRAGYFLTEDARSDDDTLVSVRLHEHDGSEVGSLPALGGFRVLRETLPADAARSSRPAYALFGVVPGARLRIVGASPGVTVTALTEVRTNTGRLFLWRTSGRADESGSVTLRVPYATGLNGSSVAGTYRVYSGVWTRVVGVREEWVLTGAARTVALGEP